MKQIVCDRCHQIVSESEEEKVREIALVDREGGHMDDLGDFCSKCLGEFRRWLKPPIAAPEKGSTTPRSTRRRNG